MGNSIDTNSLSKMRSKILLMFLLPICTSCWYSNTPSGFAIKHIHEFDSTLNYRIDVDYPFFSSKNTDKLNRRIKGQVDSNIFEFKKFILDFEGYSVRSLTYQYNIKTNKGKLISLTQRFEWAVPGVERVLYQYGNINFDLDNNRFIEIDNLFKHNLTFRDSLRSVVETHLRKDSICSLDPSETFENYYFSEDTIFFNLNYTESPQCDDYLIAIDKKDLKEILK